MSDLYCFPSGKTAAVVAILGRQHSVNCAAPNRDQRSSGMLDRIVDQFSECPVEREFPLQIEPADVTEVCSESDGSVGSKC